MKLQHRSHLLVLGLLILSAVVVFGITPSGAYAANINVTTTNDELNNDGDCSLREAIQAANTDTAVDACPAGSGADTIRLPAGTYQLRISGQGEDANQTGDLDITGNLTLSGAGASSTIVEFSRDDGVIRDRVFEIQPGAVVEMSGLTIQHGEIENDLGGGIQNFGTLTLKGTVVTDNQSLLPGGGISSRGDRLTILDSTITFNRSFHSTGGILVFPGSATILNSTISNNDAFDGAGGGIVNGGTLEVRNSTISGNSARGECTPDLCVDHGGGLFNGGTATLTNVTISGNQAGSGGGGVENSGTLWLNNVTIAFNVVTGRPQLLGQPVVGGIQNNDFLNAVTNIRNSIIARNTAPSGEPQDCGGTLTSQGYNLIQNTTGCTITGDPIGNKYGVDPLLGPLSDNGGPTQTHALLPGSPAIDAGNPAPPGSGGNSCEPTDQRGVTRPQDGNGDGIARCDIGAYERQEPTVQQVRVDIKPGSATNSINLKSHGVIPVAILSTSTFDARTVNPKTVCFGDAEAPAQRDCTEAHGKGHFEDVNRDGRLDLVLHFETQQTGIDPGDTQACLTGKTFGGVLVQGCDAIRIVQ